MKGTASFVERRVSEDSIWSVLHRDCHRLFPDEMFADLFDRCAAGPDRWADADDLLHPIGMEARPTQRERAAHRMRGDEKPSVPGDLGNDRVDGLEVCGGTEVAPGFVEGSAEPEQVRHGDRARGSELVSSAAEDVTGGDQAVEEQSAG